MNDDASAAAGSAGSARDIGERTGAKGGPEWRRIDKNDIYDRKWTGGMDREDQRAKNNYAARLIDAYRQLQATTVLPSGEKRKWSEKNMRVWGKRKRDDLNHSGRERFIGDIDLVKSRIEALLEKAGQRWSRRLSRVDSSRQVHSSQKLRDLINSLSDYEDSKGGEDLDEELDDEARMKRNPDEMTARISALLDSGNSGQAGQGQTLQQPWGKKGWANNNVRIWG